MKGRKVYVVFGTCGEYSDRDEWPVAAYLDEKEAKNLVVNATVRAKELYEEYKNHFKIPKGSNEFDPEMKTSLEGTSYFLYEVDLYE